MSNWIKILYTNSALVAFKNLKWKWSVLLYVLIVFMISAPFSVSLFSTGVKDYVADPVAFETDFTKAIKALDCSIDENATLNCLDNGQPLAPTILEYTTYKVVYAPGSEVVASGYTIVLGSKLMEVTDSKGTIIIEGTYDYLIGTSFKDLKSGLEAKTIDAKTMADNFLRSVVLSTFGSLALTRTLVILINTSLFVMMISFFFRYVSVKRPTVITLKQSFAIVVQSMFGPALLAAFIGMFLPEQAMLLFLLLFVVRFMWLYQDIIHKKISLN